MSCITRLLIGRIVDGPTRDTVVNVLLDKVFDPTSPNLFCAGGDTVAANGESTVKRTWQRARVELNYGFSSSPGHQHPPLAEWITLSSASSKDDAEDENAAGFSTLKSSGKHFSSTAAGSHFLLGAAAGSSTTSAATASASASATISDETSLVDALRPANGGAPTIEMVQLHATQNVAECIATVVVAFLGPASAVTISPSVFEAMVTGFPESIRPPAVVVDGQSSGSGDNSNPAASAISSASFLSHLLKSPPNIDGATDSLVHGIASSIANNSVATNIRAALDPIMAGGIVAAASTSAAPVRDPWLTLLSGGSTTFGGESSSSSMITPNPNFAALSPLEVDKIDGALRPMITQRLGFGSGSAWISRPLAFPFLQSGATASSSSSSVSSGFDDSSDHHHAAAFGGGGATQALLNFPAVFVIDVIAREVTENATVIRDCTEVWCDIARIARLPSAVLATSKGGCGRRVGVVAMDWSYINSAAERAAKLDRGTLVQNESFSAGVKMDESFASTAAANGNAAVGSSFYLSQTQKLAFDWSTLRRSHSTIEDAAAAQSLPWTSAPPRAVGPALIRRPLINEFSTVYEAALTRAASILFGVNPAQMVSVRGLRAILFAVAPGVLRSAAAPLAEAAAFADSESHKNLSCRVDVARAGARWVARRFAAAQGGTKKAEAQQSAMKKSSLFGSGSAANSTGGSTSASSTFGSLFGSSAAALAAAAALLKNDPVLDAANNSAPAAQARAQLSAMLRNDGVPEFKRVARVASQQPRCLLANQDDATVGVKSRLFVAPQALRPVVVHSSQQRKKLLLECTFRFTVVFTSPTSFDSSSSFSSAAAQAAGGGSSGGLGSTAFQQQSQPLRVMHESLAAFQKSDISKLDTVNNEITASGPSTAASEGGAGAVRKICVERFRATIRGAGYNPHTPPGQNPQQASSSSSSGASCAIIPTSAAGNKEGTVDLKSSVPGALISVASAAPKEESSSTSAAAAAGSSSQHPPTTGEADGAHACIVWTLPPGTVIGIGEEMSLTGKVTLETVWPDEQTAACVAESIRNHAAKPFAVPPMQAQLEFLAFADGDFGAADDVSLTGSHIDAFTATAIHSCTPDESEPIVRPSSNQQQQQQQQRFSDPQQQQQAARPVRWRNFSEAVRAAILQGAGATGAQRDKVMSCLLAATRVHVDTECELGGTASASRVETLLPDWNTSCSSQHLAATMGSQLGELLQRTFHHTGGGSADYSNLIPAIPKARLVACGPQWGSSYIVWST